MTTHKTTLWQNAANVPVEVTEVRKLKRASGTFRNGVIEITVPMWWNKTDKLDAIQSLITRLLKSHKRNEAILKAADTAGPRITLKTNAELTAYVQRLNAETFNVPVQKIRLGNSKYSQLAQMNIQSRVMTVSKYCTHNVPEAALRYLIIHELAHLLEASHNKRFWFLVARFVPDYKQQSRIIKAFHHNAVENGLAELPAEEPKTQPPKIQPPVKQPKAPVMQQLKLFADLLLR